MLVLGGFRTDDRNQCADITLVEPEDADEVPAGTCQNSSTFGFNLVYTTHSNAAAASPFDMRTVYLALLGGLLLSYFS